MFDEVRFDVSWRFVIDGVSTRGEGGEEGRVGGTRGRVEDHEDSVAGG